MLGYDSDIMTLIYSLNESQRERLIVLLEDFRKESPEGELSDNGDIPLSEIIERINRTTEWEKERKRKEEAASRGETTIPNESWGVHRTHCCSRHGCKYGTVDCPVVLNLIKQEYPCESCEDDNRFKGIFD